MPCAIVMLLLGLPRLAILLMVFFGDYIGRGFAQTPWPTLLPLLGFLFMPYTTIAYAFSINTNGRVDGLFLALVIVAVLVDLGVIGGSRSAARVRVHVDRR
jgi:hypothetical protein